MKLTARLQSFYSKKEGSVLSISNSNILDLFINNSLASVCLSGCASQVTPARIIEFLCLPIGGSWLCLENVFRMEMLPGCVCC
jgi:hypothetical protein